MHAQSQRQSYTTMGVVLASFIAVLLGLILPCHTVEALVNSGSCSGGCDIFLKGQYIEVGIHRVGSYGTQGRCPSTNGHVTFEAAARQGSWNNGLGFIAD